MPKSKKTRTRFTERQTPRHLRRIRQTRREVAAEAARIIATEGQHNYHAAKKKAAERIGVSERLALPSNLEVKDALKEYQSIYGGHRHAENLQRLRQHAATAMRRLQDFNPRLVGTVLDGTADEHSRIALHVFVDSTEQAILFMQDHGISFREEQRQIRWHGGQHRCMPLLVSELEESTVEMMLFNTVDLRQAPPSPIDGRPQHRAGLAEVEYLLAEHQALEPQLVTASQALPA